MEWRQPQIGALFWENGSLVITTILSGGMNIRIHWKQSREPQNLMIPQRGFSNPASLSAFSRPQIRRPNMRRLTHLEFSDEKAC